MKRYRPHEFARRAGVTVRTLHHYDRLGLLCPSGRSEAGHRLYTDRDLLRLEQILVLKLIGLSLKDARSLLERDNRTALPDVLARQQRVLAIKRLHLDKTIRAIDMAKGALAGDRQPDWELFTKIIKEIVMQNEESWQEKYFSDDAKARIESRKHLWSPELQERVSREWSALYRDVDAHVFTRSPGADREGKARPPWTDVLAITELGRAVLAGKVDFRSLNPPPRWVGGVEVAPGNVDWRWDERRRDAVRK